MSDGGGVAVRKVVAFLACAAAVVGLSTLGEGVAVMPYPPLLPPAQLLLVRWHRG